MLFRKANKGSWLKGDFSSITQWPGIGPAPAKNLWYWLWCEYTSITTFTYTKSVLVFKGFCWCVRLFSGGCWEESVQNSLSAAHHFITSLLFYPFYGGAPSSVPTSNFLPSRTKNRGFWEWGEISQHGIHSCSLMKSQLLHDNSYIARGKAKINS